MAADDIFDIKEEKKDGLLSAATTDQNDSQGSEIKTTASNQDWEKGTLDIRDDGVYFTPHRTEGDTVSGQLQGLLSSGSPYITSARANAQQAANKRGLLNTSLAATAGEKAAIDSALPIAQQDANYLQQQGVASQQGSIQSGLQQEQGEIQEGLYETQGNISSRLQSEGAQQASDLSAQEYDQSMALKQADIEWNKLDLEARMQVEYDRLSQENKARFDDTVNKISEDYMNDYVELMINPNIKNAADRQKAIDILAENTRQRYAAAAAIAGVELEWDIPSEAVSEQYDQTPQENPYNESIPQKPDATLPGGYTWVWNPETQNWFAYNPNQSATRTS